MRIGCLQFAPQVGDVDNNLNRADSVLSKANPEDLDLLVLPELAFSGYNFKSLQHISPFLEPSGSGITSLWARTTALKYNCNLVAGYPEKVDTSSNWPTGPEYYNSAIVVNGDGETIGNYRKSFLYYTDETWALEGNQGFFEGYIPGLGHASIGICMDLNPYKFQAPWHAFEFAFHVLEYESNLVIVSMAWMTREDGRLFSRMPNEPDMDTLTYWVTRLEPLIRAESDEEIIVVFCNRTGIEDDAVYAGTSAVVGVQDGEVKIYGLLGRGEKELLVVDTSNPPYAKLVYRPEPGRPSAIHSELQRTDLSPSSNGTTISGSSSLGLDTRQGFASHTPVQPTSPPNRSAARSVSSQTSLSSSKKSTPSRDFKVPPKIKIPQTNAAPGSLSQSDSAQSPSSESINLPTPTAPSPTPQAVRPKLIIPQSPPLAPWQFASPIPLSSQSSQSFHSVRSNSTVTSNPRPPEDSTPYPDSGLPLSGYPTRFTEKRIYGGDVSISQAPFTPITPFDDKSPGLRYFWRPPDTVFKTPMSPEARTAIAEPDYIKNQTFPKRTFLPQQDPPLRTHSSNTVRTTVTAVAARKDDRSSSRGPKRATSKNPKTRSPSKSRHVDSKNIGGSGDSTVTSCEPLSARPSSPKSRNASRTGRHERSTSSLALREQTEAITHQLSLISQRAESADRSRSFTRETGGSHLDRPSSKSRNCSRGRPSKQLSSIWIAASPGVLRTESPRRPVVAGEGEQQATQPRSLSRSSFRERSLSITDKDRIPRSQSGMSVGEKPLRRPASRAASRGRQPGPDFSPPRMVPQDPSQRFAQGPGDLILPSSRVINALNSGQPLTSPASEPANTDRVEPCLCPDCPVHGRHLTSSAHHPLSMAPGPRNSPDPNAGRSISSPASSKSFSAYRSIRPINQISANARFSIRDSSRSCDVTSLSETIESISITSRSPSTPLFEPRTPKAMVLIHDNEDTQAEGHPLLDLTDVSQSPACLDSTSASVLDRHAIVAA